MAWNEPGGDNRDPWSGGGGNQGPPDLDEALRRAKQRLSALFGGKSGGNGGGSGPDGGGGLSIGPTGIGVIIVVIVLGWLASGVYIVDAGWRGVELRFGQHVATTGPGPHWHLPYPVGEVEKVRTSERRRITVGYEATTANNTRTVPSEALMLTEDENIVNVHLAVQYDISDPAKYLFNFLEPQQTLKSVTESALRETVGKNELDFILTEGRAEVAMQTRQRIEETLKAYDSGINLVEVAIQDVQPPEQVQDAFADAIKAREDRLRLINQAQAYQNEIIPRAQGQAARISEEAEAYREQVVAQANGETDRFAAVAKEYNMAPQVTRERLYIESVEDVLSATGNILIDSGKGNGSQSLLYLPVEKLMEQSQRARAGVDNGDTGSMSGAGGGSSSSSAGSSASSGSQSSSGGNWSESRLRTRESR
ncbi:FtsH protease activity modulator HflK [Arhodomonas aquaeolei]|uniref:FtsH protease activity modulator HflK n=1 Tax=Arhodomonas aquaeolei TaxID=2369 RepID=UPI002166F700|nr:FtsH protease activity modulator HflK [Arhodomonas aquaeolei]MCS4505158.1 FtsH protease activity modulator HflK [Arhodomonas aquaeolei]